MSAEQRLVAQARLWGVSIDEIRKTETSLLGFGTRNGRSVVLKVIRKIAGEEWRCGEILSAFAGHGMIQPLEHTDGAVLLPRLQPGHDLSSLSLDGRDNEATEVIAASIQQMSGAVPAAGVRSIEQLLPDFARFRDGGAGLISMGIIERAEAHFGDLCATQQHARLLHGDLHHYNILFDNDCGWVVIDPWGASGEVEYEVGAALRNPIDAPQLLQDPAVIERRLRIYEERLKFNADRALRWAFATAVLGVLWPVEEGFDMRAPFAKACLAMLPLLE